MPQLGGFGIELVTWLEAEASAGWIGGADCGGFRVMGVWLFAIWAEALSGEVDMILLVDDILGWGIEAVGYFLLGFGAGVGDGDTVGTSCIGRVGWTGTKVVSVVGFGVCIGPGLGSVVFCTGCSFLHICFFLRLNSFQSGGKRSEESSCWGEEGAKVWLLGMGLWGGSAEGEGPACARGFVAFGAAIWGIRGRWVDGGGWDFAEIKF